MKNEKISRRSFLKASAVASALGVMAAAPAAHAAGADAAAAQIEEENCLLKKPKYIFLFIGDGLNDCSMIAYAGVGVAMQNAEQPVKDAAVYVTAADNNHDGVAEAVEKFILREE